jgi:peroxiredoxin Q/BCP
MGIDVGDKAPAFSMANQDGHTVSLADYAGKQDVVLYFYPKADTPGCTAEACSFRDNLAVVQGRGAAVLGVSPDPVKKLAKFAAKFTLGFPLLADEGSAVATAYDVWVEKSMYGRAYMGNERTTFLIGKDGMVKQVWRKVNPNRHVTEVLAAL